jgi:hypothetical protein
MSSIFRILHIGILHIHLSKSPAPCGYILFTVLHVTAVYMYNIYKASCQSRLGIEDHDLTYVAHVTTAA